MSHPYPEDMPEGTEVAKEKGTYVLYEFEQDALNFIDTHQNQPFFLYLALNMPHANNEAGYYLKDGMEVPDHGQFTEIDWPSPEKGFARMMQMIDESVGKVMTQLERLGLEENTLVIFTSDNGPHEEGGHSADFFDSNGELRGGQSGQQTQHDFLYWEFYELGGRQAVREGRWKYIRLNVRDAEVQVITELYDLETDLSESSNLIGSHPEIANQVEERMKQAHVPHDLISLFSQRKDTETRF